MKQNVKRNTYKKGIRAEQYAALYLMLKGYRILKRRYKTKVGEVDLIARRGNTTVFVEVKAHGTYEKGAEAVTLPSRRRITAAARLFIASDNKDTGQDMRFDVIVVHNLFLITHLKNAWIEHD